MKFLCLYLLSSISFLQYGEAMIIHKTQKCFFEELEKLFKKYPSQDDQMLKILQQRRGLMERSLGSGDFNIVKALTMLGFALLFTLSFFLMGIIGYFLYRTYQKDQFELWKMRNQLIQAYEIPGRKLLQGDQNLEQFYSDLVRPFNSKEVGVTLTDMQKLQREGPLTYFEQLEMKKVQKHFYSFKQFHRQLTEKMKQCNLTFSAMTKDYGRFLQGLNLAFVDIVGLNPKIL